MKLFITGVGGQLGYDVAKEALKRGHSCIGSDILAECNNFDAPYIRLDITDTKSVNMVLNDIKPDVIVHCAAWTAVDAAEDEENIDKVKAINVTGTKNIAEVSKVLDCKMIYISTDYVCSFKTIDFKVTLFTKTQLV